MRKINFIILSIIVVSSCATKTELDTLKRRVDSLENDKIATIDQQIKAINLSVTELESTSAQLSKTVADLSKSLNERIDNLKTYTDTQIKQKSDWASATFSTLEQYQSTLLELEKIRQSVKATDGAIRYSLDSAITKSEESMRGWVNERLTGYYDIAQTEAALAALEQKQGERIDSLANALNDAKTSLKADYEKAIKEALEEYDGTIPTKIAKEIEVATGALKARIDAIDNKIAELEKKIGSLISKIQSVVVIPEFEDGSVAVYSSKKAVISFEILPAETAKVLALNEPEAFSLKAVYTKTKALSTNGVELAVTKVQYIDVGVVSIFVDCSGISDSFYSDPAHNPISARLQIKSGMNELTSQYFPLKYQVFTVEYVDLGLDVLWANCNLGAISPEDLGDRYAWGEIKTKSTFTIETYPAKKENYYPSHGEYGDYLYTKYNTLLSTTDITLYREDDAAYMSDMSGANRCYIPNSTEDWYDLQYECHWSDTLINGISCFKVAGTWSNPTNFIILPKANFWTSDIYYSWNKWDGMEFGDGYYINSPRGNYIWSINPDGKIEEAARWKGFYIRPVKNKL